MIAFVAGEWALTRMRALVPSEILVCSELIFALIACKRALNEMDAFV